MLGAYSAYVTRQLGNVIVDPVSGRATVDFDVRHVSEADLRAAIDRAGYRVEPDGHPSPAEEEKVAVLRAAQGVGLVSARADADGAVPIAYLWSRTVTSRDGSIARTG